MSVVPDDAALMAAFDAALTATLDDALPDDDASASLNAAIRHACVGGKRLRALLVYRVGAALRLPPEGLQPAAIAVELIHAYSLVHDDLPAMDNDDLRRGLPTVHRAFGEATAILAGDALNTLAFEVLAAAEAVPEASRLAQIRLLARAAGTRGMVGGQHLDLTAQQQHARRLTPEALQELHRRKTGALIGACFTLPAELAGLTVDDRRQLERCGAALGLAYQIQDDLLDVDGATDALGKTAGKDARDGKQTYVSLWGVAGARQRAEEALATAREAAATLPAPAPLLALLARIGRRQH